MYVGVGARRVRGLFAAAKKASFLLLGQFCFFEFVLSAFIIAVTLWFKSVNEVCLLIGETVECEKTACVEQKFFEIVKMTLGRPLHRLRGRAGRHRRQPQGLGGGAHPQDPEPAARRDGRLRGGL